MSLDIPKKLCFSLSFFNVFVFRGSRVNLSTFLARRGTILRPLGVILGRLGAYLSRVGAILGRLGRILASQKPPKIVPRGLQEASKRPLDESRHPKKHYFSCVFRHFCVSRLSGQSSHLLRPSWSHLAPSWRHLGASWCLLAPSWCHLGPSWRHLGTSWRHLGLPEPSQKSLQDASKTPPKTRSNIDPTLEAFRDHF